MSFGVWTWRYATLRLTESYASGSVASFTSVEQLQEHIDAFIEAYNDTATPLAWTKKRVHQQRFKNRRITQL